MDIIDAEDIENRLSYLEEMVSCLEDRLLELQTQLETLLSINPPNIQKN